MDEIKAVLDVVIPVTIYVRKGDREGPLLRQGLLEFSAHWTKRQGLMGEPGL